MYNIVLKEKENEDIIKDNEYLKKNKNYGRNFPALEYIFKYMNDRLEDYNFLDVFIYVYNYINLGKGVDVFRIKKGQIILKLNDYYFLEEKGFLYVYNIKRKELSDLSQLKNTSISDAEQDEDEEDYEAEKIDEENEELTLPGKKKQTTYVKQQIENLNNEYYNIINYGNKYNIKDSEDLEYLMKQILSTKLDLNLSSLFSEYRIGLMGFIQSFKNKFSEVDNIEIILNYFMFYFDDTFSVNRFIDYLYEVDITIKILKEDKNDEIKNHLGSVYQELVGIYKELNWEKVKITIQ